MFRSMIAAFALVASAAAFAAPAYAVETAPAVAVSYADIDMSTERGARVAYERLENAAERVCSRISYGRRDISARREARRCEAETLAAAVDALDTPMVTALHNGEHGRPIILASR